MLTLPTVLTSIIWLAATFVLATCVALLITPLVIRSAGALQLFDAPDDERRIHDVAVPRLGGIAFYLSAAGISVFMMVLASRLPLSLVPPSLDDLRFLSGLLAGSALMFLVGLLDDVRGLRPAAKALAQIVAAVLAIALGARLHTVALGYGAGVLTG